MEPHLGHTAAERHFNNLHSPKALEDVPIWWKDIQTNQWHLGTLLTWGRGSKERPLWVPSRCIKPYHGVRSPTQCNHHSPDQITTSYSSDASERPVLLDKSLHEPPLSSSGSPDDTPIESALPGASAPTKCDDSSKVT